MQRPLTNQVGNAEGQKEHTKAVKAANKPLVGLLAKKLPTLSEQSKTPSNPGDTIGLKGPHRAAQNNHDYCSCLFTVIQIILAAFISQMQKGSGKRSVWNHYRRLQSYMPKGGLLANCQEISMLPAGGGGAFCLLLKSAGSSLVWSPKSLQKCSPRLRLTIRAEEQLNFLPW